MTWLFVVARADLTQPAYLIQTEIENCAISVAFVQKRSEADKGNGAQGRNRTSDTVIFSHVLYQLSYLGARIGRRAPAVRQAVF